MKIKQKQKQRFLSISFSIIIFLGVIFSSPFSLQTYASNTVPPSVASVTVPADGTYRVGQNMDFTVVFNEEVTVDTTNGIPCIYFQLESGPMVNAYYVSGTNSSSLLFQYTVALGDWDSNGISLGNVIDLNNATIKDKDDAGYNIYTSLNNVGNMSGVKVDGVAPSISSVTVPTNGTYIAGQNMNFTVNFSENANVAGGTPSIPITLDTGGIVNAVYVAGTSTSALVFRYTVQSGNLDSDGIAVGAEISLNNATLKDGAGNNASLTLNSIGNTSNVHVDAVSPTVSISSAQPNPTKTSPITITINFSENVTGFVVGNLTVGNGSAGNFNTTNASTYTADITPSGQGAVTVDIAGGVAQDAGGNNNLAAVQYSQTYDSIGPTLTSSTLSASNAYMDLSFSEGVYGANNGITAITASKLALSPGSATNVVISSIKKNNNTDEAFASTLEGGETTVRVFLTITGTPDGSEVIEIKPADAASIYDVLGNAMLITQTSGIKSLNDKSQPSITTTSPVDDAVNTSISTDLTITFNEKVVVGSGYITLKKTSDDSTVEAIDVTSGQITGTGTATITVNPTSNLLPGTEYYVLIDATAFDDSAGNSFSGIASKTGWSFTTLALSTNANLSSLTLSQGTLSPVFDSVTTTYTASVSNSVSSITVTPTVADAGAAIKVNTILVTSGLASGVINLSVGSNALTIDVTAEDGVTLKTYQVTLNRASAPTPVPVPVSTPVSTPTPSPTPTPVVEDKTVETGVELIINGKAEKAATATIKTVNDKKVMTVIIDADIIDARLNDDSEDKKIIIPVNNSSNIVIGELSGQTIKNMESKDTVLEIKTENVTYTLPASQINIDSVSKQIGSTVELKDIKVQITVAEPTVSTVQIIEETASLNQYQIVVRPVEFSVTCTHNDKTVVVSRFSSYVERTVAIPDGIDPSKILTGIVLNTDGTFSHIPTTIVVVNGKYYAKINSLTNSTYSVIWNPKTFTDITGHWAQTEIQDMGTRMIVEGIGEETYLPDGNVKRSELIAAVIKALGLFRSNTGEKVFKDVDNSDWYFDAISIAYQYGIISGDGDGYFRPDDEITRQESMSILYNAMKIANMDTIITELEIENHLGVFSDASTISNWARNSAAVCIKEGIFVGNDGRILASEKLTRAQMAVIVQRLLKYAELI